METLLKELIEMKRKIAQIETQLALSVIVFPSDGTGKLILPRQAGTPTADTARVGYNNTTNKMVVCENGVWKTVTTS